MSKKKRVTESVTPHRFKLVASISYNICPNPQCIGATKSIVYYPPSEGPGVSHTKAVIECGTCGWPLAVEIPLAPEMSNKGGH